MKKVSHNPFGAKVASLGCLQRRCDHSPEWHQSIPSTAFETFVKFTDSKPEILMLSLATKFAPERLAFETAAAAGFRAAEFWLDANLLAKGDEIAAVAARFPFRYALHFPNKGPISTEALNACVALYRQLKCTAIVIHQPMFDRYGAALRELDGELDLAIENHILDQTNFDRWADRSPGLTLDVEHLWKFTLHDAPLAKLLEQVDRFLDRHAGKLHHVHLPGYVPGGEEHCPIHFSKDMASEVLTRLTNHGFKKLVVSEADSPFQTTEFLEQDVQWFEDWQATQR
jgi:sugar phosphate isomerase/epimerase